MNIFKIMREIALASAVALVAFPTQALSSELPQDAIRASFMADYTKLVVRGSSIMEIDHTGRILKRNANELIVLQAGADGNVVEQKKFQIPEVQGKIWFDAESLADNFIKLTHGIPSEPIGGETEDSNNNLQRHYSNTEVCVLDLVKGDIFKIEAADFTTALIEADERVNPVRLLVHELGYKPEGEKQNQDRYRYFNLNTREYGDVVFDFHKNIGLDYKLLPDGSYSFGFATEYEFNNTEGLRHIFRRVVSNNDGSIGLGPILFSIAGNPPYTIHQSNAGSSKLIFSIPGGDGLRVPYTLDLARKRPMLQPLLTDDEMDELESDVYDVQLDSQGRLISHRTHFERSKIHCRETTTTLTGEDLLLEKIRLALKEKGLDEEALGGFHFMDYPRARGLVTSLFEIIGGFFPWAQTVDGLSEEIHAYLSLFAKPAFRAFLLKVIEENTFTGKVITTHGVSIRTADDAFNMPLYWTAPAQPDPQGWFIIEPHGGPHARDFNEFDWDAQFWVSRGYPYVQLNIRGSTGFGFAYQRASDGHWWDVVDDIKMAIDWARGKGLGQKAIVVGTSFGAYAAAACHAKGYSDLVIATNGTYDLLKDFHDQPNNLGREVWNQQFGTTEDSKRANSVTTHMAYRPGTKMLLVSGLKDTTCLPIQSDIMRNCMIQCGNHVEHVTMAEEGHTIGGVGNRHALYRLMETFLGDFTGYPQEGNGYGELMKTPGVFYQRVSEKH